MIPDVEANSGSVSLTRDIVKRLRAAGYRVPLLYLPRWYWQQIGSPSLAGLPPLWSSRYPDNKIGGIKDEYRDVPPHFWDGYGGLPVAVLQFTSSARVAGRAPIDGNAYRGTLTKLWALFNDNGVIGGGGGGGAAAPGNDDTEGETEMLQLEPGHRIYGVDIPKNKSHVVINFPVGRAANPRIKWIGPKYPTTTGTWPGGDAYPDADWVADDWTQAGIRRMRPMLVPIPQKGKEVEDTPIALTFSYDWDTETGETGPAARGTLTFK